MPRRPTVPDRFFDDIQTSSEEEVGRRFQGWVVDELHPFLNGLSCLDDVQVIRKRWKARTGMPTAFGTFRPYPRHWCSFNHGGRSEAQFNVGLYPSYLRVGLGFEFTEKMGGNPTDVAMAFTMFRNVTRASPAYAAFVKAHRIEAEFLPAPNGALGHVPSAAVLAWEPAPSPPIQWVFFGRMLRRGTDREILEDPLRFGNVLRDVFAGFKPFWVRAQEQAAKWK
jgi:hypothetical protein